MKVTTERTADCNAVVTVEVDEDQIAKAMQSAAQRISRSRPMPGFRPGKAPYALVERTVGKEALRDEAVDELAQSVYRNVLRDEKIDAFDMGQLEVAQKEPLILKFTIPTRPVVKLGDYHSIHLKPNTITVTEEEVDKVLERFQAQQTQMVPVTRPVQLGDLVTINLEGGLEGQEPTKSESIQIRMEKDKSAFPWFEQMVGMNANEARSITYAFPAEDENTQVAGKTATYSVTATDIKEPHSPAIDDELAKSVSQFENLDQFKISIRSALSAQKQSDEDNRFADEAVDSVVALSEIAYPAGMMEDQIQQEVDRAKNFAARLGLGWDKYLELANKTEAAFRDEVRPRSEKSLKRMLTIVELMNAEKVQTTGKDIDMDIERRAKQVAQNGGREDQARRQMSTPAARRDIEFNLKFVKTVERLVAMVKGEPTTGLILTPELAREEERSRALQTPSTTAPAPGALITDPSQIRSEDWPRGLDRPLIPGQDP